MHRKYIFFFIMKKLRKDNKTCWQMPRAVADSQVLAWQKCQVQISRTGRMLCGEEVGRGRRRRRARKEGALEFGEWI